jgi:ATP-binding cassette subfamily B protein
MLINKNTLTPYNPEEKMPNTLGKFTWYFMKKGHLHNFVVSWILGTLGTFAIMSLPYSVKMVIDESANFSPTMGSIFDVLILPLTLFIIFNLLYLICRRLEGWAFMYCRPPLRAQIRQDLFGYLQQHSHGYFLGNFAGSLAHKITEVSYKINDMLMIFSFHFLPVIATFISSVYFLGVLHWGFIVLLVIWLILYCVGSWYMAKGARKYSEVYAGARSKLMGQIVDTVTNASNVRIFARYSYEHKHLQGFLKEEITSAQDVYRYMDNVRLIQGVFSVLLVGSLLFLAVYLWESLTAGDFAMIMSLGLLLMNSSRGMTDNLLAVMEMAGASSDGIKTIIQPHGIVDEENAKPLVAKTGNINFNNVSFQHHNGTSVFDNLSLEIPSGQKVGLVGASGAGKSTFVNLIMRFYDIQKGNITIDGENIANVKQDSLREAISVIPQEPMLFHRSLLENIRYGCVDATDEEVKAAAKKAYADTFILESEDGYDAMVGERGVRLSGGQRQRVAVARAILKNSPILILDEATASLDSESEAVIQKAMEKVMDGKTVMVIAHRLSTIANMDRILVFDNGRIIEDGSHDELLKQNGQYANLWKMQSGGFLQD